MNKALFTVIVIIAIIVVAYFIKEWMKKRKEYINIEDLNKKEE